MPKYLPVNPKNWLDVVGRIPRRVKDDDAIGGDQVDAETSGFGRDEEKAGPMIRFLRERILLLQWPQQTISMKRNKATFGNIKLRLSLDVAQIKKEPPVGAN